MCKSTHKYLKYVKGKIISIYYCIGYIGFGKLTTLKRLHEKKGMTEILSTADDAVLKNSIDSLKAFDTHVGRLPRYEDNETGLERFKEDTIKYFESVRAVNNMLDADRKPLIITVEGWLVSLGLTRQSLSRYRSRGTAWANYIDYVREVILTNKLQRYMTGAVPPVSAVFDLVNNHGYRNTSDAGHITDNVIESTQAVEYPRLIDIKGDSDHDRTS